MDHTDGDSVDGVVMPRFDTTGPYGMGPTGFRRGGCLGQEADPVAKWISAERAPNVSEQALWERAQRLSRRVMLLGQYMRLQFANILLTYKWASDNDITLDPKGLPELEPRMITALEQIDFLYRAQCDVDRWKLGVAPSASGNDLDIVNPSETSLSGIWIPIAIGAVVVAGIIARWAYLEKEVQTISDKYNGLLHWSDLYICSDPKSQKCIEWREHKIKGGYKKNETLLDSIKSSIKSVGGGLTKGLGVGLALLIPIVALLYLPRKGTRNG